MEIVVETTSIWYRLGISRCRLEFTGWMADIHRKPVDAGSAKDKAVTA